MPDDLFRGNTPLDPDEAEGLLHPHVTMRRELDELEEANIQAGMGWGHRRAVGSRRTDVLTDDFLFELHARMFDEVWDWAGEVRRTNKNIGVDKIEIRPRLRELIEDARYWRANGTFEPDELAVRFHRRLVSIHPFPNGNGRHARMMADLLVQQLGRPAFTWGGANLAETSELRTAYLDALRAADRDEIELLVEFARS